jgi:hypothetical protein
LLILYILETNINDFFPGTSTKTGRVGPGASLNGGDILLHGKHFRGKPRNAITLAVWLKLSVTAGIHSIFSTTGDNSAHRKGQVRYFSKYCY